MKKNLDRQAPGCPGDKPRWTSAAKSAVGTASGGAGRDISLVWFTLAHGIFNEIFYPHPDLPCTRDFGLIVTDGQDFFSEEKRHATHELTYLAEGVPAYRLINTCEQGRYRIVKIAFTHPRHSAVIQRTRFIPLRGRLKDYHLYALLAPHLGGQGAGNRAWIGDYKGQGMLFAERQGYALALACSSGWSGASAGFVGVSDGWQELHSRKRLTRTYSRAEKGNVALTGEVDLATCGGDFVLALGFGASPAEAGLQARSSLLDDPGAIQNEFIQGWKDQQETLLPFDSIAPEDLGLYRTSAAVMCVHDAKSIPGTVASLSIPWGMETEDGDRLEAGYHLVWPRDLVETAGGLLAAGADKEAIRRLVYLQTTQEADGHWPQNMWLSGEAFWTGIQLCETGLPVLLLELLRREGLDPATEARFWPMVRAAAAYLVRRGPVTDEDRWEREPGYTPFTVAVITAALLAAADMAEGNGEAKLAPYLRETADFWNACIEGWLYVEGTDLARRTGVEGYYARVLEPDVMEPAMPGQHSVRLKASLPTRNGIRVTEMVSPDALALVRFGLRAADDPRIVNTLKVIDALLKVETPFGPCWRRFNGDEYGETKEGMPFPGHGKGGIGRAWPLLTGERAHFELAAGRRAEAERLLRAMQRFANEGGMLPEQIWDVDDIPKRGLVLGRPTGSAMPLAWAHAEYVKLLRSLQEGRVFDMPRQTVDRYLHGKARAVLAVWRFDRRLDNLPRGAGLRIEVESPAVIHWSADDWTTAHEISTRDTGFGTHVADLPTKALPSGRNVQWTFRWTTNGSRKERKKNFQVSVMALPRTAMDRSQGKPSSEASAAKLRPRRPRARVH